MGRNIDRTDSEDRVWYLPDIEDNRQDPEPFMVLIGPIDGATMRKARSSLKSSGGSLDQDAIMDTLINREERLRLRVVEENVFDVSGYSLRDAKSGKIKAPKNGKELVDAIMSEGTPESEAAILTDVYDAIVSFSSLSEEVKKRPSGQSVSSSPTMNEGRPGDAVNAEDRSSQTKIISDQPVIVKVVQTDEALAVNGSRG